MKHEIKHSWASDYSAIAFGVCWILAATYYIGAFFGIMAA